MKRNAAAPKKAVKKKNPMPLIAAGVVLAAALTVLAPRLFPSGGKEGSKGAPAAADGEGVVVDTARLGAAATFFPYRADGVDMEVFAVKTAAGEVRLALNTCQVCNGSPYAYFKQEGDAFICQNCGNRFSAEQVGVVSGGCNPVPITEQDFTLEDGNLTVPAAFLEKNAARFKNWKKF